VIDLGKVLDALKLAPRYLLAVAFLCGIVLFAPMPFARAIGLEFLRAVPYRTWIGGAFIVSAVLLIVHSLAYAGNVALKAWRDSRELRRRWRGLRELSPPEAKLLARYLKSETTSLELNAEDGIVNGLVARGILYPGASYALSQAGGYFEMDFNLHAWAWKYLREHPEIVNPASPRK